MRKTTLLLLLIVLSGLTAFAQDQPVAIDPNAVIELVEISGIPEQRLSDGLRGELRALVDQRYDPEVANMFADRIQAELPEYVAASRIMPGTQPDRVRLVFAVAEITDRDPLGENVNARYSVEAVDIEGYDRDLISAPVTAALQAMIGKQLDDDEADRLRDALSAELPARYVVEKRVTRGSSRQFVKVVYTVLKLPMLPFRDPPSFVTYHQKFGLSAAVNITLSSGPSGNEVELPAPPIPGIGQTRTSVEVPAGRTHQFTAGISNTADDLIERYKGFRVGFEHIQVGTERIGLKLDYMAYGSRWQNATEVASLASPDSPGLYRSRRMLEPSIAIAFTPNIYGTVGVSVVDLEMQYPDTGSRSASAGIASIGYRQRFEGAGGNHTAQIGYDVRSGTHTLESDYIYTRHFVNGRYSYEKEDSSVYLSVMGGRINGNAPLFDRFALGNTQTLRGWNKFDLTPLGAYRVVHGSLEYVYKDTWKVFYDSGSVWDAGQPIKVRSAIGGGVGDEEVSIMVGFRIEGSRLRPAFMVGGRFNF